MTAGVTGRTYWTMAISTLALAWVPYLLVTWAIAEFLGQKFWVVLLWLVAARLFFAAVELIGSVLAWRMVGKKKMTTWFYSVLAENGMPCRYSRHDTFLTYTDRILNDESATPAMKATARDFERVAEIYEAQGILAGMRVYASLEAALEKYSPRSKAPEFLP